MASEGCEGDSPKQEAVPAKIRRSREEDDHEMAGILEKFSIIEDRHTVSGRWKDWLVRFNDYVIVERLKDDREICAMLRHRAGKEIFDVIQNLPSGAPVDTYKGLTDALTAHFAGSANYRYARWLYQKCKNEPGELVSDWAVRLKKLASRCELGKSVANKVDDSMVDKIICDCHSEELRRELLRIKSDDLTLERVLMVAKTLEESESQSKHMASGKSEMDVHQMRGSAGYQRKGNDDRGSRDYPGKDSHYTPGPRVPPGKDSPYNTGGPRFSPCFRCGSTRHSPDRCYAIHKFCHRCGQKGHFSPMCKSGDVKKKVSYLDGPEGNLDKLEDGGSDAHVVHVGYDWQINAVDGKSQRIWVQVVINGLPVDMQLDTAADITLMSEDTAKKLSGLRLEPTKCILYDYSRNLIPVLGTAKVLVDYDGRKSEQLLTVVKGRGHTLLGMDWVVSLKLDYMNWAKLGHILRVARPATMSIDMIVKQFDDVFSEGLGTVKNAKASLVLKPGADPKFLRPRAVPYGIKPQVEREIQLLEASGAWVRVTYSEWATPLVPVSKPDGGVRLCGDYKSTVNPQLQVAQHPLPNIQDMLAALGVCKVFSKIDLRTAFQQLVMDDKSQEYCTVNTHLGLFRPTRLPYGIASSPAIWQQTMDKVFNAMPGVFCFVDDILIAGKDELEHQERLMAVLTRIRENGLRVKRGKCQFNVPSIEYLGFLVDKDGVHKTDDKIRAVRDAGVPTNVKELQAFLGLVTFYGKFVRDLATIASPLYALLGKGVAWVWSAGCQEAVRRIKMEITSPTFLAHFDRDLPLRLVTDASDVGLGAVLAHTLPNGEEKPIAYASRMLNPAERKYSQIEKEALSLIYGVSKFHMYLYGRDDFTLVTDHKPLLAIMGPTSGVPKVMAARLYRWSVILAAYNYTIEFRSTTRMGNADALSRFPVDVAPGGHDSIVMAIDTDSLPLSSGEVALQTARDPVLMEVLRNISKSRYALGSDPEYKPYFDVWQELGSDRGCIFRGDRIVIPTSLRGKVLSQLHEDHQGIVKTKALARSYVWWPGMDDEIEGFVKRCRDCALQQNNPKPVRLHPWEVPDHPWQRLHIDYAGPFLGHSFLIVVDAYSKWPEVIPMSSTTSLSTVKALMPLIAAHGLPDRIVSDNGPQFTSGEFAKFCQENGIRHTFSAPYHPATNGEAERFVQTFKRAMKCRNATAHTVAMDVCKFLFAYRNTPHSTTGVPPASLLMGRRLRCRLDLLKPDVRNDQLQSEWDQGQTRQLEKDDTVMARLYGSDKWIEGTIKERLGSLHYNVVINDRVVKRHIDQLRPYEGEQQDPLPPRPRVSLPLDLGIGTSEPGLPQTTATPPPQAQATPPSPEQQRVPVPVPGTRPPAPVPRTNPPRTTRGSLPARLRDFMLPPVPHPKGGKRNRRNTP